MVPTIAWQALKKFPPAPIGGRTKGKQGMEWAHRSLSWKRRDRSIHLSELGRSSEWDFCVISNKLNSGVWWSCLLEWRNLTGIIVRELGGVWILESGLEIVSKIMSWATGIQRQGNKLGGPSDNWGASENRQRRYLIKGIVWIYLRRPNGKVYGTGVVLQQYVSFLPPYFLPKTQGETKNVIPHQY
jgi:hypothetical protein